VVEALTTGAIQVHFPYDRHGSGLFGYLFELGIKSDFREMGVFHPCDVTVTESKLRSHSNKIIFK